MFQKSASEKVLQELRAWVAEVWDKPHDPSQRKSPLREGIEIWHDPETRYHGALVESVKRLHEQFKSEDLGSGAAELYFHPLSWLDIDPQHPLRGETFADTRMFYVFETLLCLHQPDNVAKQVMERMTYILHHPVHGAEKDIMRIQQRANYYPPDLGDLQRLFRYLPKDEQLVEYATSLLRGEFNIDVNVSYKEGQPRYKKAYKAGTRLQIQVFMEYLHRYAELPYDLFRGALLQDKGRVWGISHLVRRRQRAREAGQKEAVERIIYDESYQALVEDYLQRFTEEIAADIREDNYGYLKEMNHLTGSRWLLTAAELHQRFKLKKLVADPHFKSYSDKEETLEALVIHLANAHAVVPQKQRAYQQLIEALQAFPKATLRYLVPVTKEAREVLLEALDWGAAQSLIAYLLEVGMRKFGGTFGGRDVANSPDPASGAVDLKRYREARALAGEELSGKILKLFYDARVGVDNTIRLLWAAEGIGREKILKHLAKSKKRVDQKMIKAFGLLPLEEDQEALERYLFLQEFLKESKKHGPERQANERGAVKTALYHLAQVAGYPDVMRLEWHMEARLTTEVVPVGRRWEVGDYRVELQLKGSDPDLVITKGEKRLKSVPKAVRASDDYPLIRASVEEIRKQARRFRGFFEDMMVTGKEITREDLELLNRMPVPSHMLSQLIVQTQGGVLGLYRPEGLAVETLAGEEQSIGEAVIIAHPYHLQATGELEGWQRLLVGRRIVQPFKQTFRELYLLTPAEQETRTYSNRFAGHVVDGAIGARLFQARGWDFEGSDVPTPQKLFPAFGFSVRFEFPDARHYWSSDPLTSDQIKFRRYPLLEGDYKKEPAEVEIPLTDIPPVLFSEVMRDADLVVSVAQVGEKELLSKESVTARIDLVQALLEDLNLEGVHFQDHFAHVQGKLAQYRIHMGSATIHIEPGGYLCVVPKRWGKDHKDVFLPFSDAGDDKTSEVISKILLLLDDDKIKDKVIKTQIERHM